MSKQREALEVAKEALLVQERDALAARGKELEIRIEDGLPL